MTVLSVRELRQGTFETASVLIPNQRGTVTAIADMPDEAMADPSLVVRATLLIGSRQNDPSKPLVWTAAAEVEWTGGGNSQPTVAWTGSAYRAKVRCEVSKPTYINWDADTVPAR